MAERNARPVFEGKNRRTESRRIAERRKHERIFTILKFLAVIVFIAVFVKIFSL
ncbi:MAG TPA: hypothetical protein VJB68_08430 [Methylophilaceae bacterium]|nr:hypothetical protein [Methylophilaceae bacterium]